MNLIAVLLAVVVPVAPLPVTPGAINPAVTQANIQTTICKSGWTDTIRPPVSYTNKLKTQMLATSYKSFASLYGSSNDGYELDHLISLELGGNPTDPKNLWPEPYASPTGAKVKDVVETKLKTLVCAGKLPLADAQKMIATNWYAAYLKYGSK